MHYLEALLNESVEVIRNDKIHLINWNDFDAIVISPGPGLPNEANQLMEALPKFITSKKVFGVCLGMQAIVEYFGGALENLGKVHHGLQTNCKVLEHFSLFKGLPENIKIGRYHSWVSGHKLPNELVVIAKDEEENIMAIKHENLPIYGVQFHPESVLTPNGKSIIENWLKL